MMSSFATVVDYRHYRLVYTTPVPVEAELKYMYNSKNQTKGLHPTLIYGFEPIELLSFLETMMEGLEALGISKVYPSGCFSIYSKMMRRMCIRPAHTHSGDLHNKDISYQCVN